MRESLELYMKGHIPVESASAFIDEKIKELGDWRGKTLAKVREIIHEADPEIVEEWKWSGNPGWSHGGIVCTGEAYKNVQFARPMLLRKEHLSGRPFRRSPVTNPAPQGSHLAITESARVCLLQMLANRFRL